MRFSISRVAPYQASVRGLCDGTCHSVCLCVCPQVYCGKTAEWKQMPFGMVSGVGRGMGVLDGGCDRRRGRVSFGGKFGASHCNQRDFAMRLFPNYSGQDLLLGKME